MNEDRSNRMPHWEDLADRHLHGELRDDEKEVLAELLDSDRGLREDFVRRAIWESELAVAVRAGKTKPNVQTDVRPVGRIETRQRQSIRVLRAMLAIAATMILVLSGMLLISQSKRTISDTGNADAAPKSVAEVTGLSGALIWTGDRGQILRDVSVGTNIAGGTIEGLSPDSWFELRFLDGSEVTISGASMLTFSDDGQKRLRLREGRMSADVARQPKGKPMRIQTRSATLTVLGTSFDVEADLPATSVSVREGTVRVTRSSDGEEIDVPANHRVIASADRELTRQPITGIVHHWKSRLEQGPDETYGKWLAATKSSPATLKAVAFVPKQAPQAVLFLPGLGVRSEAGFPVQVAAGSRFKIRGTMTAETDVYFGMQIAKADGNYAGKFLAKCHLEKQASGDFVATAVLEDFDLDPSVAAYKDKLAPSPEGLFVNGVWCFTHSDIPSGLRVSEVALENPRRAHTAREQVTINDLNAISPN